MPHLGELLDDAVGDIQPRFSFQDLEQRLGQSRRRRRLRHAVLATMVVVGLGVGALALVLGSHQGAVVSTQGHTHGVFPESTGSVLVLADGYDGATFVDLDHRVAVRRVLRGARAGDAPFPLTRSGDSLIVGWGEIYAVPLDGSPARHLGTATISVPAAEPGAVWLIDYPGGRIGTGTPTIREVDLTGQVLVQGAGFDPSVILGTPDIGVPGGLAYEERGFGLVVWDPASRRFTAQISDQPAIAVAVHDNLLAWAPASGDALHVLHLGGPDVAVNPPAGQVFEARSARFSPDGQFLAVVTLPVSRRGSDEVIIVDTARGTSRVVAKNLKNLPTSIFSLEWSPDSRRIFFTTDSYQKSQTTIGEYTLQNQRLRIATLPFGGALTGLAVDRNQAQALLSSPLTSPARCPPPMMWPSRRAGACAFHF